MAIGANWVQAVLAAAAVFAGAAAADDGDMKVGAIVKVEGSSSDVFAAGAEVTVSGAIGGELFAAGAVVVIDADIAGDTVATGADVFLGGSIDGDAAVFGADVVISAQIEGDAAGGASSIVLEPSARINGDAAFGGASLVLEPGSEIDGDFAGGGATVKLLGFIDGDVSAGGARVVVDGEIDGDVTVSGEEIVVGPLARINGAFKSSGPKPPQIDPAAVITGEIEHETVTEAEVQERIRNIRSDIDADMDFDFPGASPWFRALMAAATAFGGVVLGLLFPAWFGGGAGAARSQPLMTFGVGLLFTIFTPIAVVVSIVTLIGAPFGLALLAIYFVLLATAGIGAGYGVGTLLVGRFFENEASPWVFLAGFVIVCAFSLAPYAGGIIGALAWVFGMGVTARGAMIALRGYRSED
ncbi:MAG: hypothetical protein AAFR11_11820 [Pseudomonadota bacterium]